jgi:GDP/UDP-N,N'-diacetylbacillosamine 2-epimerase (hydrolysing)
MPYAVVTYHPVTLNQENPCSGLMELLKAIDKCKDMQFVITKSNADDGGTAINQMLEKYCTNRIGCVKLFDNLGQLKYLSAVKYSEFVLGNSSSGVIEVPALKRPTVNIGIREKGRLQVESIINCEPESGEIMKAIKLARSINMQKVCNLIKSPFDGGDTSVRIKTILKQFLMNDSKTLQKSFYDVSIDNNS